MTDAVIKTRNRTTTDAVSGLQLNPADFPGFSQADLVGHFTTFQQYDLDSTGFISPENLLEVLTVMEVKDASLEMVKNIIEEVAVLVGHDNDGKLSFRDYMHAIKYDKDVAAHNLAVDAQEELTIVEEEERESMRDSMREESEADDVSDPPAEPTAPTLADRLAALQTEAAEPKPGGRLRTSSMGMVAAVANVRIKAFQQVADEATARNKLAAFTAKGIDLGPMVNTDEMLKESLRNKVKAFETAAKFKGKVELRKTWKQVGGSRSYNPGTRICVDNQTAKPPPKKKLSDLP